MGVERAHEQARTTVEAVARNSRAKLVAYLAASSGDLAAAERQLDAASAIIGPRMPDHFPPAPRFQTLQGSIALARAITRCRCPS